VCLQQCNVGSNPTLSAFTERRKRAESEKQREKEHGKWLHSFSALFLALFVSHIYID
jgi:hypothetical protein